MFLSILGLLYFGLKLNTRAILSLIPFGFATFLYVSPIKKLQLRNVSRLKLFLIAFSWTGVTVLFPLIQEDLTLKTENYTTFILRFLFVLAITIPFDIRDMHIDPKNLQTIPQKFGIKTAKNIILFLVMLFILIAIITQPFAISITNSLIGLLIIIFSFRLNLIKNKYHTAFLIEALPIIWWLLFKLLV
jgi:4-hydroxybenzoate polyprenyltransferase